MARNNPRKQDTNTPGYGPGEVPPMVGGTPGIVVPEGDKRLSPTAVVSNGVLGTAKRPDVADVAPAKEYTVVSGPTDSNGNIMVLYNRVKTRLQRGKTVSAASVDIESLVKQGVQLREIVPPVPEPTPETEETSEGLDATGTED